jgi:hypothetical protein
MQISSVCSALLVGTTLWREQYHSKAKKVHNDGILTEIEELGL